MKKLYILLFTLLIASYSSSQVIIAEDFTYPDGSLVGNGGWANNGGTAGDFLVSSGQAVVQHGTPSEDVKIAFSAVTGDIYVGFDFSVDDLGAPYSSAGNDFEYFAHFNFRAQIDIVPPTGSGDYTIGVSSDANTAEATWGTDLTFGTTYRAIMKFNQGTGTAQLWINPTISTDTSITGTDDGAFSVTSFDLRQSDSDENETIRVDDLMIGQTFDDVVAFAAITDPTITVGEDVSGLDYFEGFGPSSEGSFSVEGINLTEGILVTSPTNFEVSLTSGGTFTSTVTVSQSGGTASDVVYVRLVSGLTPNTYTDNATATSAGATGQTINLNGIVSAAVPQITVTAFLNPMNYSAASGGPSPEESFTVEGLFLTSDIVVTSPSADFELSLTSGGTFSGSVSVPFGSGTVMATDVFVRLATSLPVGPYSGDLTVSSTGVTDELVPVSGNVFGSATNALILTGVYDGPLSGGTPKGVEIYVVADVADLSLFGLGSANNGGGTDGQEFTFPSVAASAGTFLYVASEATQFTDFFGFAPDYTDGSMGINGDDAVELFENGTVIDTYGVIDVNGDGEVWDYTDGWAYRLTNTGPDGTTFVPTNWDYSGIDVLDGETSNTSAATPFPTGSYPGYLSVSKINSNSFNVFPNPTNTGFVNISSLNTDRINAQVFDILGKKVLEGKVENNQLNVSNLNAGMYIMRLSQNNATVTKKLIIQ